MTCEHCGVPFHRKRASRDARRFCSKKCGGASRSAARVERIRSEQIERQSKPCRGCARPLGDSVLVHYCSESCQRDNARKAAREAYTRKHGPTCATCSKTLEYRVGRTRNKYCSAICRERGATAVATKRASRLKWKVKERRRNKAATIETVDPLSVLMRDGWKCQMCGIATPRRLRGTYLDNAPELDHIVPLSKGGAHSYANTQCACRRCNASKSDAVIGQFRLAI